MTASVSFLPWLRRGVSAHGGEDMGTSERLTIPVMISFGPDREGKLREASIDVELYGPGEVVGLDAGAVVRTWPAANTFDMEPNFFPLIEFDQPDLPWRYCRLPALAQGSTLATTSMRADLPGRDRYVSSHRPKHSRRGKRRLHPTRCRSEQNVVIGQVRLLETSLAE
jgi:hypothetical protein